MAIQNPNDSGPTWLERLFTRPRTAFGGDPATTMSPRAQAEWDRSTAEYAASPMAAAMRNRQALGDQSRTAAYDPTVDMYDPRNMRPVDFQGNTLWTVDYSGLPEHKPAQPATKLSSSQAITDKINKIVGPPQEPPPVTTDDWRGRPPDDRSLWAATGDTSVQPQPPYLGLPLDQLMPTQLDPRVAGGPAPGPGPSSLAVPAGPLVSAAQAANRVAKSGALSRYPAWRNRQLEGANQWLQGKLDAINNWNGKIYASGGPVGYAEGGSYDADIPGMPMESGGDDGFIPMTAFGSHRQIGPSQAVMAPAPPPLMPSGGGGGGGGGKSGIGSLLGPIGAIAGSFIPGVGTAIGGAAGSALGSMFHDGGRVGFMRGGYPELYTRAQRTAFSTGGGEHYVRPDGRGNGRSDHIDASLSPGEFVMDAETVSMAGDGDNNAGARQFERLRKNIRTHKGKQLAKGKFSPKAKPVEQYMSSKLSASDRAAHGGMSDGLRQMGRV
jgi:hypothetical protein